MKAIRKSADANHKQARKAHTQLKKLHTEHVARVKADNQRIQDRYKEMLREHRQLADPETPSPPEPALIEIPEAPELVALKPHEFQVAQATGKEGETHIEVETQWGKTLAPVGSYLLTDESGKKIIIPEAEFERDFKVTK